MIKHLTGRSHKEINKLLKNTSTKDLLSSMFIIDKDSIEYKEICKRLKVNLISNFKILFDLKCVDRLIKQEELPGLFEKIVYDYDYEITIECHPDKLNKVLKNFKKIAHIKNHSINNAIFTITLTINFIFK